MIARALGVTTLVLYSAVVFGGFDFDRHEKTELAPSVRQAPGGYRSWSFWHSGSHGGK